MPISTPPNVLFVVVHDMSPRWGCYGDPYAITPRLDELAGTATRFDRHYCPWPLCGPSRACLFSGLGPQHTQRHNNRRFWDTLRDRQPAGYATMGEAFRNAGYRSEHVWHVLHGYETDPPAWSNPAWMPTDPALPDWAHGIDPAELRYWRRPETMEFIRRRVEAARARGVPPELLHRHARGPAVEAADVPDHAYPDGQATDHACGLIAQLAEGASAGDPFFLAVGYEAGHLPWTAPTRDFELYDRNQFTLPIPQLPPVGSPACALNDNEPTQYYTQSDYEFGWAATAEQTFELMHGAYASISFFDRQVGRLLDALRDGGVDDNTVVVVTTDHGFHLGEHNYFGKHTTWDQSMRCPLIVRTPGQTKGVVVEACTEHIDLLPSLCRVTGISTPEGLDGKALFTDDGHVEVEADNAAFSYRRRLPGDGHCGYFDVLSIRTPTHRLSLYRNEAGQEIGVELFDYEKDIHELRNHAGSDALMDIEATLRARLAPHLEAYSR